MKLLRVGAVAGAAALVLTGVPAVASAGPASCDARVNNTSKKLLECVTVDGVRGYQAAFQAIADANGGTRLGCVKDSGHVLGVGGQAAVAALRCSVRTATGVR